MPQLRPTWLDSARKAYLDDWLWDKWGFARGWPTHFPEMLLWYSAAGAAFLGEEAADTFVKAASQGHLDLLPERRRATWRAAQRLSQLICTKRTTNPVDWFTGGCKVLERGWKRLDDIPGIGPKIASFLLRDLSFLRDYSDGRGGTIVRYGDRLQRRWFERLTYEDQALFIPIDRHVHVRARKHLASKTIRRLDVSTIQAAPDLHRTAATEIVAWARARTLDPRDVNMYWYSRGAGNIHKDGTPTE